MSDIFDDIDDKLDPAVAAVVEAAWESSQSGGDEPWRRVLGKMGSQNREIKRQIRQARQDKSKNRSLFTPSLRRRLEEAFREDLEDAVGDSRNRQEGEGGFMDWDGSELECRDLEDYND